MQMPGEGPQVVAEETYTMMMTTLLNENISVSSQITANYGLIDYGFLQRLDAEIAKGVPE